MHILQGDDTDSGVRVLRPLKCELACPSNDWQQTWRLARLRGLGPENSTFLLKMIWGILPCKERVSRILPNAAPECQLCNNSTERVPETLEHALLCCEGNNGIPNTLLTLFRSYVPDMTARQLLTLDLNLDSCMELPLVWILAVTLSNIWDQRKEGRVCPVRTRADLEARCRLLREGKGTGLQNAFTLASIAIQAMYRG